MPSQSHPSVGSESESRRTEDQNLDDERPGKKRKQRQQFSCAECRRLKLKCDRQVPCANCIRRSCQNLCPDRDRSQKQSTELDSNVLLSRLGALEGILNQHGIALPSAEDQGGSSQEVLDLDLKDKSSMSRSPSALRFSSLPNTTANKALSSARTQPQLGTTPPSPPPNGAPINSSAKQSVDSPVGDEGMYENGPPLPRPEISRVRFDYSHPPSVRNLESSAPTDSFQTQTYSPENSHSYGTLVISQGGRSKYLGPTAASEWLKDQEIHETETVNPSRIPSPVLQPITSLNQNPALEHHVPQFPFQRANSRTSTAALVERLPERAEGMVLVEAYFRYFAWHFNVVPRGTFQPMFDRIYDQAKIQPRSISVQELGLIYIVLAMGTLQNLELLPNDPAAEEYSSLAKSCLAKGDFLSHNTVAGVQALHIMAHYQLETEKGRGGDSTWPLWGMAMRIIQAMGLHRDGARWNLPPETMELRRRVFWECHTVDIFQAHCFSRPCSMSSGYIDTAFPTQLVYTVPDQTNEKDFATLQYELAHISGDTLDMAMKVNPASYSEVMMLHQRVCVFERHIPYYMRCRAALVALPSVYPNSGNAIQDSPLITKGNVALTFQQCTLAINICETLLYLHRPYFAHALHQEGQDPTRSEYGQSYLVVVERCHVIISVVSSLYAAHPNVCARHWFLWYHTFNTAVCMGTLILRNPKNSLAPFALLQIDSAINLYLSVVKGNSSKKMMENLHWLSRLRDRVSRKMNQVPQQTETADQVIETEEDDIELIGWRTRLIERIGERGGQTVKTIPNSNQAVYAVTPTSSADMDNTISNALQQILGGSTQEPVFMQNQNPQLLHSPLNDLTNSSTDELLHQFWDPMMLQEHFDMPNQPFTESNWWEWSLT